MNDRFDFEQRIQKCWMVTDDIYELAEGVLEHGLTTDQITNVLFGMKEMYELKFNKLWDLFEHPIMDIVRENKMLNEECAALRQQLSESQGCGSNYKSGGAGRPTLFGKLETQGTEGSPTTKKGKK
jgi:hypothetical protein